MKIVYTIVVAFALCCFACDSKDENPSTLHAYFVTNGNNTANIATFDYPEKKLTPDFFSLESAGFNSIQSAAKNDAGIYLLTSNYPPTLRKIHLTSGLEVATIPTWWYGPHAMATHGNDVILCAVHDENSSIRIYDESLALKDSTSFALADGLSAAAVVNDRLFISQYGSEGGAILVYDLNSAAFLAPIDMPSFVAYFIPIGNNKLMAFQNNGYFTIDAETLTRSDLITAFAPPEPGAYDSRNNRIVWLSPVAQPSIIPDQLVSTDIATGKTTSLNTDAVITGPLVYDETTETILTGPGVQVFSKDGKLLHSSEIDGTTSSTKYIFLGK